MNIKIKKTVSILLVMIYAFLLSGCWNYREVEDLSIVMGVAVSRGTKGIYKVAVELAKPSGEKSGAKNTSEFLSEEGDTLFEAVRKMITMSGKRLYWSHCKVLIISDDIARSEIVQVLDWFDRDSEIREDIWVLVSREKTASDILEKKPENEELVSVQMSDTLRFQSSVAEFPNIQLWRLIEDLSSKTTSPILPSVGIEKMNSQDVTRVSGTAIFKKDKLITFLDEDESKWLLIVKNMAKGGIIIVKDPGGDGKNVSLEIHKNDTKIIPEIVDGKLKIKVHVKTLAEIGEIEGQTDYTKEDNYLKLKDIAERQMASDIEKIIRKFQKELRDDALGFGEAVRVNMNKTWKAMEPEWEDTFPDIETEVIVDAELRGTATKKQTVKCGK